MTKRKAILHIGTMKTGTSSIQAMLAANASWLAAKGYAFVPGIQRTPEEIASRIEAIGADKNIIISDEGLWHHARTLRSKTSEIRDLLRDFDVTVIVYFRRPDHYLESWFVQGLKYGRGIASVEHFLAARFVKAGTEFYRQLKIFADLFGKDAIRIAPYERAQWAQGDVVTDFLVRCGLAGEDQTHDALSAEGAVFPPHQNVSPDTNVVLLISLLRQFGHLPEAALSQALKAVPVKKTAKAGRILTWAEAKALNARFRPVLRRLQAEYGGGADPDFLMDWSLPPKSAAPSPVRKAYDDLMAGLFGRLIDLPVETLPPPPPPPPPPAISVAFVIQKLAGLAGGAERVFVEAAEAMAQRGMAVRIVTFDPIPANVAFGSGIVPVRSVYPVGAGMPSGRHADFAVKLVKALPNISLLNAAKWRKTHGAFAAALKDDLTTDPVDIVVAFLPPAITAAAVATEDLPVNFIASTHNVPELDFGESARWDQNPVYRKRAREALAEAAKITVLMPAFRDWFPADVQPRVVHLPNPVRRLSPELPGVMREKVVLGVGRLTTIKRWDVLINAFAEIAVTAPEWQLHIYGEGPEHAALQAQIAALGLQGRARLMGVTPTIGAVYDRASILAHPSRFEGFGLSVAEGMAHGLPAIAFADCAGVNALIEDGKSGRLIVRDDDGRATLAAGLTQLCEDEALRARLGQAAKDIAKTFDPGKIYEDWDKMLRDVAGKQAPVVGVEII